MNGDGLADIVGFGDGGVFVSLAAPGGSFGSASLKLNNFGFVGGGWVSEDKYPRHVADVNGDGLADVVGFGHSGVWVSLATGGETLRPRHSCSTTSALRTAAGLAKADIRASLAT
jgi:hypothetical protein